mgnify:CR=1 FL=1
MFDFRWEIGFMEICEFTDLMIQKKVFPCASLWAENMGRGIPEMHCPLQHDKFLSHHHVELGDPAKHKHLGNRAAVMFNENVQNESKWSE